MEAFAAESGGMPQLNPEFWVSQIFWLIITFGILYVVLSKLILPKISANLETRKSQILENIEAAASIFSKIWDFLVSRLALIFGSISLDKTTYKIPKVIINQKIWETQNSGFNWGIPPLSAAKASIKNRKLKNIDWKNIFLIIKFKMQIK